MRSRLEPFKKFVRMLRSHLDGVLASTKTRISSGAVEGMNNKIKSISHRSFGFRSAQNFIAAIYHCCARLPLPAERKLHFLDTSPKFRGTSSPLLYSNSARRPSSKYSSSVTEGRLGAVAITRV